MYPLECPPASFTAASTVALATLLQRVAETSRQRGDWIATVVLAVVTQSLKNLLARNERWGAGVEYHFQEI